nr:MAG: RNA replicase beta chain [Sanya steitz-like virus 5]
MLMSVQLQHDVVGVLEALLKEGSRLLHDDIVSILKHHLEHVAKVTATRGPKLILVDLPRLGKKFDKGLSSGFFKYEPEGDLKAMGGLLRPLISLTFRSNGELIEPTCPDIVRYTRTVLYLFKKVEIACPENIVRRYHHEFFTLDESLSNDQSGFQHCDLDWSSDDLDVDYTVQACAGVRFSNSCPDRNGKGVLARLLSTMDRIRHFIIPMREFEVYEVSGRHGPGAVSDLKNGEDKYLFPSWSRRLSSVFPPAVMMTHWGWAEFGIPDSWGSPAISKLIAVPKTYDKPRLIASEPTANMWCQQAILKWIRRNMTDVASTMIDFSSQEPSRVMALHASQGDALAIPLATIDLESASDRLLCSTVEKLFAPNPSLLLALMASRSVGIRSEVVSKQTSVMCKYAPQGNATTFPVQSLTYATMALSSLIVSWGLDRGSITKELLLDLGRHLRVFGDDIIIPVDAVMHFGILAKHMLLKVNVDKTHISGKFRESCGMDAYNGVNVTPLYLSSLKPKPTSLSSLASWVAVSNNARIRGYTMMSEYLADCIPGKWRRCIPTSPTPQEGLWLWHPTLRTSYPDGAKIRYNSMLQQSEFLGIGVSTRVELQFRDSWSNLLQYFTEVSPGNGYNPWQAKTWDVLESISHVGFPTDSTAACWLRWQVLRKE